MSTVTSRYDEHDVGQLVAEEDYDVLYDQPFNLYVEHKVILARLIDLRHPEVQVDRSYWRTINGASFWGFLREYPIDRVLVTLTEPLLVVVLMADEEGTAYFRIPHREWMEFINVFSAKYRDADLTEKVVWQREGF